MNKIAAMVLILLALQAAGRPYRLPANASPPDADLHSLDATYWVSPDGQAAWGSCSGVLPLEGLSACALSTANTNAIAGDTVFLRGGTYTNQEIRPDHAGLQMRIGSSSRVITRRKLLCVTLPMGFISIKSPLSR